MCVQTGPVHFGMELPQYWTLRTFLIGSPLLIVFSHLTFAHCHFQPHSKPGQQVDESEAGSHGQVRCWRHVTPGSLTTQVGKISGAVLSCAVSQGPREMRFQSPPGSWLDHTAFSLPLLTKGSELVQRCRPGSGSLPKPQPSLFAQPPSDKWPKVLFAMNFHCSHGRSGPRFPLTSCNKNQPKLMPAPLCLFLDLPCPSARMFGHCLFLLCSMAPICTLWPAAICCFYVSRKVIAVTCRVFDSCSDGIDRSVCDTHSNALGCLWDSKVWSLKSPHLQTISTWILILGSAFGGS